MKKIANWFLEGILFLTTTVVLAQGSITAKVIDSDFRKPLYGVNVVVKGTSNGVTTDFDGKFILNTSQSTGTIEVSYIGFITQSIDFTINEGSKDLGIITLVEDTFELGKIVVIGSGVIDLVEDRKTPVAVSTIKIDEIQKKIGNFDLPELLKSTPSVQNIKGGGFGDGKMFLRGFDQTNTAFLLNGQPINGMEDGKMYWSNWAGILDVANAIQVQRGLGSSKLAISSVGGTVNIVTKTVDLREGGFLKQMVGNNSYTKTSVYYSTGINEKGWSFATMLGHWQGNGYVNYTDGQGQTYFLSVGYKVNDNHIFNFLLTGAPQWHAAAGGGTIGEFLEKGRRYNSWKQAGVNSPNTISGEMYPGGRNIYHKPIANLNWDWAISGKSSLSTVLYGSIGRGGFAVEKIKNDGTGYVRGSYNIHNWFGLVTSYNNQLTEAINLNFGADVRTYNGFHFRGVNEFVGITSLDQTSTYLGNYSITNTYGGISPWSMVFDPNKDHRERLGYDYKEMITYYGAFGQLEYSKGKVSTFFQGAISNQDHIKTDYHNYTKALKTDKISNFGFNTKAGFVYKINDTHKVFANTGFYSRQPFHDDLFVKIRESNELNDPALDNQKITGLEAGYQLKGEKFSATLNIYHTIWDNRTLLSNNGDNFGKLTYKGYKTQGVKQVHIGSELEVNARPMDNLRLKGFFAVGNWEFKGNSIQKTFDSDGLLLSEDKVKIDGFKVGGAAQITGGISVDYEILNSFSLDGSWNWYNDFHSEGELSKRPLVLPSYDVVDTGLSYKMSVGKEYQNSLQFRLNVNNMFDEVYLESVYGNTAVSKKATDNYKGVNKNNKARFGYGRTWNFSIRYNF